MFYKVSLFVLNKILKCIFTLHWYIIHMWQGDKCDLCNGSIEILEIYSYRHHAIKLTKLIIYYNIIILLIISNFCYLHFYQNNC